MRGFGGGNIAYEKVDRFSQLEHRFLCHMGKVIAPSED